MSARVIVPKSYFTSSGPKHSAHANSAASGVWWPHSLHDRARAGPRSKAVVGSDTLTDVIARSLLICPAVRVGIGTVVAAVLAMRKVAHAGCRGFFGPIPLPLWMS